MKGPKTEDVAEMLIQYINSICIEELSKELVDRMSQIHPTLQQNFTRVCVDWFKELSEKKYYDLRNEASVLLAKRLRKELDSSY
ncbi:MAG: hypothetical protein DRG83_10455, partial [Deltaproteobacteria bacterium]